MKHGSHGPSGVDSNEWRRFLTSFKVSSTDICGTIANVAIRIATSHLTFLLPYNSSRLLALTNYLSIRPICIGEVLRRITGKLVVNCVKTNLRILGGDHQLCRVQNRGIEHFINFVRAAFMNSDLEAILLINRKNAFIGLNRDLALRNIEKFDPSLSLFL